MSNENQIEIHGIKADGTHEFLGVAATTPPEIKRKEIVSDFFEHPSGDENDYSEANQCLWALEEYHKWLVSQGWKGPKLQVVPPEVSYRAAADVLDERRRQITAEGWTPEHDDEHSCQELAMAAACYAGNAGGYVWADGWPGETVWPWDRSCWKPTTPRRDLVKAAALILAEIERLDRIQPPKNGGGNAVTTATHD